MAPTTRAVRSSASTAGVLGLAQLVAWGTLYYPLAVLGDAIARDLGVSRPELFASFTLALAIAGVVTPATGRWIDRGEGARPLVASCAIGAIGLGALAVSTSRVGLWLASPAMGLAMGLGLYDAVFAAVARRPLGEHRRIVSGVTLLGGLASTAFWPLALALERVAGWRFALATFASLLLSVAPLYVWAVGGEPSSAALDAAPARRAEHDRGARVMLSMALATGSFVTAAMSAHLIAALEERGSTREAAVALASLVGPMQVLARALELGAQSRLRARDVATMSIGGLAISLLALALVPGEAWALLPIAVLYGMANGALTIARASAPLEMLAVPRAGAGALLGWIAMPAQIARALGPAVLAALSAWVGTRTALLAAASLAGAGLLAHLSVVRRLEMERAEPKTQ